MSRWLGDEARGLTAFTEGNTSATRGDGRFLVKATGEQLGSITEDGFVEMDIQKVLKMLDSPELSYEEIERAIGDAMVEPCAKRPSLETVFHAYLLSLRGVHFVGHTHPISVNSIVCSKAWRQIVRHRITPEEVVCCGIAPACVEYAEPGVPLARGIRAAVEDHTREHGGYPKAVLMQNHGLIALGATPQDVQSITAIWDKTAKVLAGTFVFGGPMYLPAGESARLLRRPDIAARETHSGNARR